MYLLIVVTMVLVGNGLANSQTKPAPSPTPAQPVRQQQREPTFDLADYGVSFQPDLRLIAVMAALDAAGFDPTPPGREKSVFRARVRKDQADLDPKLRERLQSFFDRNKLPAPATPAEQVARYISLAFVLGQPPTLDAPERSEDLPAGVLEVLDFAPLVREFYRRSGIDERMPSYLRAYQAEGDRLRQPTSDLVRSVVSYLHTRPVTVTLERVQIKPPAGKKNAPKTYSTREHERRFYIVPDLLAAPGTINLRVIADDYYAVVPEGTDPTSSELRRAYLQYVVDPMILRFNKEIAGRREPLRQMLKERETGEESVTPDVFIAVSRSFVGAADARYSELLKSQRFLLSARDRLSKAKTEAERTAINKEAQAAISAIKDETISQLADEYERGAILAFFFAEQLQGVETSGFDVATFFPDMIASFDPAREAKRPAEYAEPRALSIAAKEGTPGKRVEVELRLHRSRDRPGQCAGQVSGRHRAGTAAEGLQQRAESRLRDLIKEYPGEARLLRWPKPAAWPPPMPLTRVQAKRLKGALTN